MLGYLEPLTQTGLVWSNCDSNTSNRLFAEYASPSLTALSDQTEIRRMTLPDSLYEEEHDLFRESFRAFLRRHVIPYAGDWDAAGIVPRSLFRTAGAGGFLGMAVPEVLGGAGVTDFRFNAIIAEESAYAGVVGAMLGITLQNDVCLPYFLYYGDAAQHERWLPGIASGEHVTAIAMTEPGTGSDLRGIKCRARKTDHGYRIDGSKTFITNGINADLIIVVAKTNPGAGRDSLSLLVVDGDQDGVSRGRNLQKLGQHAQDTAEVFFDDVEVADEALLGRPGDGFRYLLTNLAQERLSIAVTAVAASEAAVHWTREYARTRHAFGSPIGSFQNTRFVMAECVTSVTAARAFLNSCIVKLVSGALTPEEAAMAKLHCTELQGVVLDRCLQIFGGYGYMLEYPIARAYADARVTRIFGGTSEVMKEIIGHSLELT